LRQPRKSFAEIGERRIERKRASPKSARAFSPHKVPRGSFSARPPRLAGRAPELRKLPTFRLSALVKGGDSRDNPVVIHFRSTVGESGAGFERRS
jgi:hypothetical protein